MLYDYVLGYKLAYAYECSRRERILTTITVVCVRNCAKPYTAYMIHAPVQVHWSLGGDAKLHII